MGLAELGGPGERLAVHEREHQDVARPDLLRDRRNEAVRIPLDVVEPAHLFSVAAGSAATHFGPTKPRSAANQSSTGSVPGSTGATATGSDCHAIAWPSRI